MNDLESAMMKIATAEQTAVELTPDEAQALYVYLLRQINGCGRWVARTRSMSDYRRRAKETE